MQLQDFTDRVVLVTGAASGIGKATAQGFAERGASVAVADIDIDAAHDFVGELHSAGLSAAAYRVDIGEEASIQQLINDLVAHQGGLHSAVNCAGIADQQVALTDMSLASWERMIRINQTAVFLCMKHQLRYFLGLDDKARSECSVVNVSSGAGLTPAPGQVHYTAAKHAVLGMTKYAAQEHVNEGIRVNAVCPGYTDTPMIHASLPQQTLDYLPKILPQGRMGSVEELASVIVWLCSSESAWVNGQSIVVDGGQLFH